MREAVGPSTRPEPRGRLAQSIRFVRFAAESNGQTRGPQRAVFARWGGRPRYADDSRLQHLQRPGRWQTRRRYPHTARRPAVAPRRGETTARISDGRFASRAHTGCRPAQPAASARKDQRNPGNGQQRDERRDQHDHAAHCRSFRLKPEATFNSNAQPERSANSNLCLLELGLFRRIVADDSWASAAW